MTRFLPIVFLVLLSLPLHGQGLWGSRGISRDFVARNTLLYVADGRGVSVYETADATNVSRRDLELSNAETRQVAFAGNDLLVVATSQGMERFSVAGDGTLNRLPDVDELGGFLEIAGNEQYLAAGSAKKLILYDRDGMVRWALPVEHPVLALAFAGSYLYASVDREGVYVYDLARARPVETLSLRALGFARAGDILWAAAGGNGLFAIDVSTPAAPRILGNGGGGEVNMTDVAVSGTRAFTIQPPDRFYAFDISTPTAPVVTATRTDAAHVVAASGSRLFLAGSPTDIYGLTRETGIPVRIYDGETLAVRGEAHDLAGPVSGVATDGSIAYVVDPPYLRLLDISKTNEPREMSSIVVPEIQDRIRVKRGLAAIYGRGEVNLVDVSDPYAPKILGIYRSTGTPPSAAGILRDTIVEANYASGLHIVDYSNFPEPRQIAGRIWHYLDLVASDDAIYAILQNELLTLDLTNRFQVVDRQSLPIAGTQVELAPPNAFEPSWLLFRAPEGIRIYSLADPFRPEEVAFVQDTKDAGLMGTTDGNVYFEKDGRLWRIDLADPSVPLETNLRVTSPMQFAGAGEKLVVADRYAVRIFGPNTAAPPPPPPPPLPPKRRSVRK